MNVFGLTILLGAFLLFQVQPIMAKYILPWFGGGPGVWTACMLFFQLGLLGGYAYAYGLTRFRSPRRQATVHLALLLVALVSLPITPGAYWRPGTDADPTYRIILLLTVCLGLPYFVLAGTGPLLQSWFHRLHPGAVPYRLYSLSNAGSLLALLSYPFVFEPALTRRSQAGLWAGGFGVFVLLSGFCVWQLWRRPAAELGPPGPAAEGENHCPEGDSIAPPARALKAWWFGLAACGSVLLLATTNKLCLDVAAVPFLWLLPLSLYLLTFIISFDRPAWYARNVFTLLLVPLLALLCYTISKGSQVSLWRQILVYGANLFAGCMVCHGELCRLKPAPRFLTSFYLLIAAGGAAGGIFVGILAPLLFHSYAELYWGFWLLAALVLLIQRREGTELRWAQFHWRVWPATLAGVLVLGGVFLFQSFDSAYTTVQMTRNFYGVLRVVEHGVNTPFHAYKLNHGGTTHGLQFANPERSALATTYYNQDSGVGLALNYFPRQTNRCIGVVGLGAGTLAAYGRPGDTFRFYEINPEVRRLAQSGFSFVKNSSAHIEVVPGDARLSLETEPPRQYDILVLDAFSGDAIPVHLLTQEAFETYFKHLKPDGAILAHISNRHLDFLPVLVGVAKHFRLALMCLEWSPPDRPWWFSTSKWVILTRNQSFLFSQPVLSRASRMPQAYAEHPQVWTDDYASLFSIVSH